MQVIKYMNKIGYFRSAAEYFRCLKWAELGAIPEWLQEDYEHYKKMLKEERRRNKKNG